MNVISQALTRDAMRSVVPLVPVCLRVRLSFSTSTTLIIGCAPYVEVVQFKKKLIPSVCKLASRMRMTVLLGVHNNAFQLTKSNVNKSLKIMTFMCLEELVAVECRFKTDDTSLN